MMNESADSVQSLKNQVAELTQTLNFAESQVAFYKSQLDLLHKVTRCRDEQHLAVIEELKQYLIRAHEDAKLLRRSKFGSSSERDNPDQLILGGLLPLPDPLDEGASGTDPADEAHDKKQAKKNTEKRRRGKRKALPGELPRRTIRIEIPKQDRKCPVDKNTMQPVSCESSERLEYLPAQLTVVVEERVTYACLVCDEGGMETAKKPEHILPKSYASESILAEIIISKYVDSLPLYRQAKRFACLGMKIPTSTMSRWMIQVAEECAPLVKLIRAQVLSGNYLQVDETTMKVLKEERPRSKKKSPGSKSYVWVYYRPGPEPGIFYDYHYSRGGAVPVKILFEFRGYMQVDGYAGYNEIAAKAGIVRVGCGTHIRRKFKDSLKIAPHCKDSRYVIEMFKKLYTIEERARQAKLSPTNRYALRQTQSLPLVDELCDWLHDKSQSVAPKSRLGGAIQYALNQWPSWVRYLDDGQLEICNNGVENTIRPFAIGRKNWLFSDTVDGAEANATFYTIIRNAQLHGLPVRDYLIDVFRQIPHVKENPELLVALMPSKWKAPIPVPPAADAPSNAVS
jgi:transposase